VTTSITRQVIYGYYQERLDAKQSAHVSKSEQTVLRTLTE
jgi:hypothetical protein